MKLLKLLNLLAKKNWRSLSAGERIGLTIAVIALFGTFIQIYQSERDGKEQNNAEATEVSYWETQISMHREQMDNQNRQMERIFQMATNVAPVAPYASGETHLNETTPVPPSTELIRYDIPESDNPQLGANNAPINIVEFGDFECPFSQRWNNEVLPKLMERYRGQISFTFWDFPLYSIHPNASYAAQSAYCAGEQGNYWEYHDLLFSGRYDLSTLPFDQSINKDASLDQKLYMECMGSDRPFNSLLEDYDFAANIGVRSTPFFFINGIPILYSTWDEFVEVIEKELAGQLPK